VHPPSFAIGTSYWSAVTLVSPAQKGELKRHPTWDLNGLDGERMKDPIPFSAANNAGTIIGPVNAYRYPHCVKWNVDLERSIEFRGQILALRIGFNNIKTTTIPILYTRPSSPTLLVLLWRRSAYAGISHSLARKTIKFGGAGCERRLHNAM
jgi:hypothetical protein